jgi:hypothetical protein
MIVLALTLAGCKSEISEERRLLLDEMETVLPVWDLEHLTAPLEDAMAGCDDDELAAVVDVLWCYQEVDWDFWCASSWSPEECYAELSDECWAGVRLSDACLSGYDASFEGSVLAPTDCEASQAALAMATYVYTDDDAQMASEIAAVVPSFELLETFTAGAYGGRALLGTSTEGGDQVCDVAFRGTWSGEDVLVDLASIVRTRCTTTTGQLIGWCGDGFFDQYVAYREDGLIDAVVGALDGGMCPGGLRITGHSLGGAQASLFAAEAHLELTEDVRVHTFGEPRAFSDDAAAIWEPVIDKVRWAAWGDPVTTVPYAWLGFGHYGEARQLYTTWTGATFISEEDTDFSPWGFDPYQHETTLYQDRLDATCGG